MPKALVLGGATGLLGQALTAVLSARGWETASLGRQDGDLLDYNFLREKLEGARAGLVFNAVAWTAVDDAEDHEEEALELNRALPGSLARIMAKMDYGHLIHYSTDFVFSGPHAGPWKEDEPPNPASVYGRTKLEGERAVLQALPDRACVLRSAWLFGPGRRDFVDAILAACQKRDMVNVVDDQTGSPTYSVDLARWSLLLAERKATGLWHAVNSGQASWCELASEAVHLASGPCRVAPIPSDEWPQKAKRPRYSVLENEKLAAFLGQKPRPWQQALREHIFTNVLSGAGERRP